LVFIGYRRNGAHNTSARTPTPDFMLITIGWTGVAEKK
jgi:hypothetical protein